MGSKQAGNVAEIFNGPAKMTFGTFDLGYTRDGVEVEIEGGDWEAITVDEHGEGWIDAMRAAEGITLTTRLAQHSADLLKEIIDGSTKTVSGDTKVSWGKAAGYRPDAKQLRIHPIDIDVADKSRDLVVHKAFPVDGPTFTYETAVAQQFEVTWRGLIDTTRTDGDMLFSIGTETVGIDVTPPTVSSTVPADGASGISTGASVVYTFDEDMDQASVTDQGNVVFHDDTGASVPFTLSYNSGTFELTITPTGAMAGTTEHFVTVTQGVKDVAGNNLAADSTIDFTTAA